MWCLGGGIHGWTWFGGIGMIIFWVVILAFAAWFVMILIRNNRGENTSKALNIVRERYAKGEITKDEYDQYRKTL